MQILIIAGNVGKDAVLRRTQNGDAVLSWSLAVDNGKDQQGNRRESTWYDCSLWGKRAEALERHITKGSKLTLQGAPSARAHEGKAYLGIRVQELTFMGGNQRDEGQRSGGSYDQSPEGYGQCSNQGYGAGGRPGAGDFEDDIPFAPQVL